MTGQDVAFDYESGPPVEHGRLGLWLLVLGEAMGFAGLGAAWLALRSGAQDWPQEPRVLLGFGLAFTVVLLGASVAAGGAARAARKGSAGLLARWLAFEALLGVVFLALLAVELSRLGAAGIAPRTDVAWGMFFLATLAHAAHVLAALLWSAALSWAAWRGRSSRWRARRVEYAALFQHLVGVAWLGVFAAFYIVG